MIGTIQTPQAISFPLLSRYSTKTKPRVFSTNQLDLPHKKSLPSPPSTQEIIIIVNHKKRQNHRFSHVVPFPPIHPSVHPVVKKKANANSSSPCEIKRSRTALSCDRAKQKKKRVKQRWARTDDTESSKWKKKSLESLLSLSNMYTKKRALCFRGFPLWVLYDFSFCFAFSGFRMKRNSVISPSQSLSHQPMPLCFIANPWGPRDQKDGGRNT
jgi:hypothetical protein